MSLEIPFRFKNRFSQTTGFLPDATGICDGEFFIQQADKAILFKDVDGNLTCIPKLNTNSFVSTGQTGNFITTSQTGSFGGGNVDLTSYVTTGQTGVFALAANTGSFVTTAQTGVFALAAETGSFVTTAQTGVFALSANTGAFVTTGQTGVFITRPNDFINAGNNNSFVLGSNNSVSGCGNFIRGSSNVISGCYGQILGDGNKTFGNANGNVILSSSATISGYACNNAILGGVLNVICQNTFASVILGGLGIVADTSFTAYATNFCTYGGKYYGDGSALTGIVGAGGVSTPQQTSVLLTGATGFTQYHQAKNVGILAQNCFFGQEGAGNSGYLLLDKGGVNETNNLFTISPTAYCIGTFSAMLIGNGYVNGAATTTSMRIDGAYGNGIVLNQVKNIYFKTQNLNDANVVIEDNNFRIAVSGISGTMVWSSKIDLLDMNGYD
jgi:hypothetical protein